MISISSNKNKYLSVLFIMLSVIFWGYSFISTKIVLTELPPVSIAFFRQVIAAATLLSWLFITRTFSRIGLKHMWVVAASAFFGIVLYFLFENQGLTLTTASNASMITAAVPVFTLITEVLFFKLKVNFKIIFCIIISIFGVYLVISVNGKLDLSSSTFTGNLLVVGAMVAWVIFTIISKSLAGSYSSLIITAYQSIISIFLFIPFVIPEMKSWKGISLISLANLIYLGVFCSALAYFFYNYASKRLGATVSSAFINLIPVVSVIFGFFILHERLNVMQIAGMLLIMFSLFKLSRTQ